MTKSLRLRGTELRYVLTWHLFLHGPATVAELLQALAHYNFDVGGRGSKSISDGCDTPNVVKRFVVVQFESQTFLGPCFES